MAVGVIGMSRSDFETATPDEFIAIYDAWNGHEDALLHNGWQQTRWLATVSVQPHIRKRITPHELLPLPWEDESVTSEAAAKKKTAPQEPDDRELTARRVETFRRESLKKCGK